MQSDKNMENHKTSKGYRSYNRYVDGGLYSDDLGITRAEYNAFRAILRTCQQGRRM